MENQQLPPTELETSSGVTNSIPPSQKETEADGTKTSPLSQEEAARDNQDAMLSREARKVQSDNRFFLKWMAVPLGWGCLIGSINYVLTKIGSSTLSGWLMYGPLLLWVIWGIRRTILDNRDQVDQLVMGSQERRALTAQVAGKADIHSIGPLIDACGIDDWQTTKTAMAALTDLLPLLQNEDAPPLDAAQRARLCTLLNQEGGNLWQKDIHNLFQPGISRTIQFQIAVLQALKHVGGQEALPTVQRLATMEPKTPGERDIQREALACLSVLEQRMEEARNSDTLLRPSDASSLASDSLLRPTTGSPGLAPEELLRASLTESDIEKE